MKIQVNNTNISELKIGSLIEVTVQKFDPSIDSGPYFKTFSVPYKIRTILSAEHPGAARFQYLNNFVLCFDK
mgnify:CR=1 FL=1